MNTNIQVAHAHARMRAVGNGSIGRMLGWVDIIEYLRE